MTEPSFGNRFSLLSGETPAPAHSDPKQDPVAGARPARGGQRGARGGQRGQRGGGQRSGESRSGTGSGSGAFDSELPEKSFGPVNERGRGRGRGRDGGRGGGRGRGAPRDDRHSRTGRVASEKQLHQGGVIADGDDERKAEVQGEADAQAAAAETPAGEWGPATGDDPWAAPAAGGEEPSGEATEQSERRVPEEEVDNTQTLDEFRATENKVLAGVEELSLRQVENDFEEEGAQKLENKEEDFFAGQERNRRTRTREQKTTTVNELGNFGFDQSRRGGFNRGGRGGGEGRGEGRGRGGRGRGGGDRGFERRGSSFRGGGRGRAGAPTGPPAMADFPALSAGA